MQLKDSNMNGISFKYNILKRGTMEENSNKRQVVVIAAITAVCLLGDSMLYVVLPTHGGELGITSLWKIGLLLSANRFVRLPLNPLVGSLYRRISHRKGILIAVILASITTACYGISSFWLLLLMRCIWGLAWTFLRLGSYLLILSVSNDQNRGYYMGIYNGISRLGSLVGMLAGGFLADLYGMKMVSIIFGGLTLLAIIYAWISVPEQGNSAFATMISPPSTIPALTTGSVFWMLCSGLLIAMLYQGMFTSTVSRFIEFRYSTVAVGTLTIGAATLAGILQALRWSWEPWLAPWFGKFSDGPSGRRPIFMSTLLIASILFSLATFNLPLWLWLAIVLGIQITATVITTVMDALATDIASSTGKKIEIMTTYSISTDLGAAVGPLAGYVLINYVGIGSIYWGACFILLLLSLRWFIAGKTAEQARNGKH